jgi:hypothetical protein
LVTEEAHEEVVAFWILVEKTVYTLDTGSEEMAYTRGTYSQNLLLRRTLLVQTTIMPGGIPYVSAILQISGRIPFLCMNHGWKLCGVADRENCLIHVNHSTSAGVVRGEHTEPKNNQSRLPSSVYSLNANPLESRTLSALPFSPATVEKREKSGVFLPT